MKNWRKTREYRVWRAIVIRRDKVCQICGSMKSRNAHHINHATYFPEQRFDPQNGVCLCGECHMNFHCNFLNSYRTMCTKKHFDNFVVLTSYFKTKFLRGVNELG